jgi:hypothetical protein
VSARRRAQSLTALLVSIIALVTVASAARASASRSATLPPSSRNELVKILAPRVVPLGLHITRAALVDARNHRSAAGTHLAVYVEPDGEYSPADYVSGITTVSRAFLPFVFNRWPDLRSFDVCQEPLPGVDDRAEPPPETQVFVLRRGVDSVDWKLTDIAGLLTQRTRALQQAGNSGRIALALYVAARLKDVPEYTDASARAKAGSATTPTSAAQYR